MKTSLNAWDGVDVRSFEVNWDATVFNEFGWVGVYFGNFNVQLSAAITSAIVSRLFLDIREAAYRSQRSYNSPSEITQTIGQWGHFHRSDPVFPNQFIHDADSDDIITKRAQFIGQRTLWGLIGSEDFAVDLRAFDNDEPQLENLDLPDDKESFTEV
ncbi:hypothetical protein M422DRAFT_246947 [Sphaerobolus stellatus SS14]|nr:hypothetical protein M422DRAFT_246947 [Sphaerobolus stellatus SS14]